MQRIVPLLGLTVGIFIYYCLTTPLLQAAEPQQGTVPPYAIYLPVVTAQPSVAERIGFGLTSPPLNRYPNIESLGARWYLDWQVKLAPERPNQMDYVQMVRVHQKLACGAWFHSDHNLCPYTTPHDYVYKPSQATIEAAAKANPGSLWLIGNEMDRIDWAYCAEWEGAFCKKVAYNGQDEMLPATYAVAYHDLYHIIKAADPEAQLAIGGLIQATPLRLQYLTEVWNAYTQTYSVTMPVDVWNIHNFIIQEKGQSWGAEIPPGISATEGAYVGHPETHINMKIFGEQMRAFRQWMKDHGQQDKSLVVSEYGVLFHNDTMGLPDDPTLIHDFMIATFDYFYQTKDCELGYQADECRLVQKWNWYSLDDTWGNFNPYSRLYDPATLQITAAGERFRAYLAK